MKLISWNVNGLRACMNKGFKDFFDKIDADIFAIQETKMQVDQITEEIKSLDDNRFSYWNQAEKKGYSGTAVFTKVEPINAYYGKDDPVIIENDIKLLKEDNEGRIVTLEFEDFYFVNCYVPNSKRELERLSYRVLWEDDMRKYLSLLDKIKPVIYCGDLNVAHKEIDLKNPDTNHNNAGFTDDERNKMTELLEAGFTDTFRFMYPDATEKYSWWSYMFKAREKNTGWRIDYFVCSDRIKEKIKEAKIHMDVLGSDHCPIELEIDWSK